MKLAVDPKFLGSTLLICAVLLAVVAAVNYAAGSAAATIVGVLLAAVSVKLFDKLDFSPSEEIVFGAPLLSLPWIYSAAVSVLVLYGTRIGIDIARDIAPPISKGQPCSTALVGSLIGLDWGGFVVGGWLIGRVFPARASSLASLALAVSFLELWLGMRHVTPESLSLVLTCITGLTSASPSEAVAALADFKLWTLVGLVLRGFVTIVVARAASGTAATQELTP